ncbi:aspartate/glutamate racemase family protein [Sphingomonas corticis]|jgi:aspartate racemase|uniref:Aspartate/glutamate racemase family protein n=1 Tax=Sphingomonas corticis TaxID=2722791 RepID=A0ABX1CNF2_9SPHN|nr:aspartate/glutamate racemase family protein [Sphingomonas corticis]NJR77615.1 aspartate/glutamate racemase family protein [Sphingomonas corticis]
MRTIGLIGGMSWESSALYYRLVNEGVRDALGGQHSARLVMVSLDFADIARLQHVGDWPALEREMVAAARTLERAGAQAIVLCTNTMHLLAPAMEEATAIPLLHIADAAGEALAAAGIVHAGLLGTAFTMEQAFYRDRLASRWGIETIVPDAADRLTVHRIIYDELVRGVVTDASRLAYRDVMARLVARGSGGIVLGCTEIGLLVDAGDAAVPLFDTTPLHAAAAVRFALTPPTGT